MRSSVIVMSIVAVGLSMGARDATAARIVTADETTGQVPSDFSFLTDSIAGLLCNVNEDQTACLATPYTVGASFITPGFQGGWVGVDLLDGPGSDNPDNLSDQLYLRVDAVAGVAGVFTLNWCWDSDREPNVNICQNPGFVPPPAGTVPVQIVERSSGFTDLTQFFTGPGHPLAAGQWTIQAQSETPEPASLSLLGSGLVAVGALRLRKARSIYVRRL
jgi:hypothetical protein